MRYLWLTLLVLSPAILYGIALLAAALTHRYYRGRCPRCHERGLHQVDFILATVMINGQRAPDSWIDHKCEKCGAVVRWHRGKWEPVGGTFTFITDAEGEALCLDIVQKMAELHGITREEAIGRINRHWHGLPITAHDHPMVFHESPEDWAMIIYYGHESHWWKGTARLTPKPYP